MGDSLPSEVVPVSDGLGPMARWSRDVGAAETMGVIVQRLADGETLKAVCRSRGWPHGKVLEWLADDEDRCGRYRRAKALGSEAEVDRAQEVADGSDEPKLIVDTIFRSAEAHAPDVYGRRVKVDRGSAPLLDAALVGLAGELLAKVRELPSGARTERVIEQVPESTDAEI